MRPKTIIQKLLVLLVSAAPLHGIHGQDSTSTTIRGKISDNSGPVTGAGVFIEGTSVGTTSDLEGNFALDGVNTGDRLVISMIGYKDRVIVIKDYSFLDIILEEDSQKLSGAVVTALGIKRDEKSLSYNVQQLDSKVFNRVKDANFVNSLSGKVAGVQISSGASGPGSATRVVMRGMKSIEKSNSALYVIDGIPMRNSGSTGSAGISGGSMGTEAAADINPDDIESVTLLTGAAAAALYGSLAANGVIMITTKRGREGGTSVSFSNNTTFSLITDVPRLQKRYGGKDMNSWTGGLTDSDYDPMSFFKTGVNVINSLSVSSGNEKNKFYFSASATNSDHTVPTTAYNRYNFTGNATSSIADGKVVLDFSASYIIQNDRNMFAQGLYNNPLPGLYLFPRGGSFREISNFERPDKDLGYSVQYWPYGSGDHQIQNPYWVMNRMIREERKQRYMLGASARWNLTDWMSLTARGRVDNSVYNNSDKKYASTLTTFCGENGGYSESMQSDRNFYGDVMLDIRKDWGKWKLNANAGASISDMQSKSFNASGDLIYANYFAFNNLNLEQKFNISQGGWHDQTQSVFASVEGGWNDAVFLTLTGRNDWASQLAFTSSKSFFYPSAGVSVVISELARMPYWMDLLKVRGSFSQVASPFARYLSNPGYTYNSTTHTWSKPSTYPAHNLKPERTRSWEAGLSLKVFSSFDIDVTYYRTNTYNQTIYAPLSASTGYQNFIVQSGNIQNEGVELTMGYMNSWGQLTWECGFTFSYNKNKIIELAHGVPDPFTGEEVEITEIRKTSLGYDNVAPKVILREGGSLTDIYTNHELVRGEDGVLRMKETEYKYAGSLAPLCNMGLTSNLSFKGLSLGVVISSRIGGKVYSGTEGILDYYGASERTAAARDAGYVMYDGNRYSPEEYYRTVGTSKGGHGAYYLYDASYVRLQEVSLQYLLPRKWFKNKAGVSLGVIARNVCMIWSSAPFDPDLTGAAGNNYYQGTDFFMLPGARNIGFNVKVNF